jgi:adenylate cyclase class IV
MMNYKEIEYKYWAKSFTKEDLFSRIEEVVIGSPSLKSPETIYVVSCDDYYIRNEDDGQNFVRFRKGGGIYELTLKRKLKTNVIRKEINLNVTDNEDSAVVEFLTLAGYEKAFQVYKEAWIWNFDDCDVSYYTLSDGRSVVELEAVNYSSLEEGVGSINDWEESLGLSELAREARSLYEIFTEEGASIRTTSGGLDHE